jgi:dTDP-glucose 4,6-dehydratase
MKRVLVTGAAGFIGSNLVYELVERFPEASIHALDLLTYAGNLKNIQPLIDTRRISFTRADICDQVAMNSLFEGGKFDLVFHLAAESHVDRSILSASEFVRTNVLGTQTLLNCALAQHRAGTRLRFVHISTDEVYGSLGPTGVFTEETPLDPTSPYAASKAGSDLLVQAAQRTHHLDAVITRCTNNYGPYQFPEKFIPLFITHCMQGKSLPLYGNGTNVRSWIHVRDHCGGLIAAATRGEAGQVYNLGGTPACELANVDVARMIMREVGAPDSLLTLVADRPAHDFRYAVDISKARRDLNWEPTRAFEQGLKETIAWYTSERAWWEDIISGDYKSFYEKNYASRGAA